MGTKAVQARLDEMVAVSGRKKSAVQKSLKKGFIGKLAKAWKERKNSKKGEQWSQKAKAKAKAAAEPPGFLVGQTVRCIQPEASHFWQNAVAEVLQHRPKAQQVQVRLKASKTERWMQTAHVAPLPKGMSKPVLAGKLNIARLTNLQKEQIWNHAASRSDLSQTPPKTDLEGPELTAGWYDIFYRGIQTGEKVESGEVVFLEPHTLQVVEADLYSDRPEGQLIKTELQEKLATARLSQGRCLILAPIQADDPPHWTSLSLIRLEGREFTVKYQDSLRQEHPHCRARAESILACLQHLQVPVSQDGMPETELTVWQGDGWSCGFHTLNRQEEQFRQFRGEGLYRVYTTPEQRRQPLNRLCQHLQEFFKPVPEAPLSAAQPPPAVSSSQAGPLPLPPPPAKEPEYGCSKCRHSKKGCLMCNPEQAVRYVARKKSQ